MTFRTTISALALITAANSAFAACEEVRFSDVGWTDITATTAATSIVLEALGYETSTDILSVPVTYASMAEGNIDVFLGNWMPTMEGDIATYREAGTVDTVRTNLTGAKYTLATNAAGVAAGITDFASIAQAADALDGKIYGIEAGNDGNELIQDMLAVDPLAWKTDLLLRMMLAVRKDDKPTYVELTTVGESIEWDIPVIGIEVPTLKNREDFLNEVWWLCFNNTWPKLFNLDSSEPKHDQGFY